MNRQYTLATLVLILTAAQLHAAVSAGQGRERGPAPAMLESAPAGTVVMDDDGGRVQIVPRAGNGGDAQVTYHGGPVVSRGAIQVIFLGSGWRGEANRRLESRMVEALQRDGGGGAVAGPGSRGGSEAGAFSRPPQEDRLDPASGGTLSDLEIQARLDELLGNGTLAPLAADTVFVVFLAPGLQSTLGASRSDTDFAAYHNYFHAAPGLVRYVVVPHEARFSRWLASAERGLVQALINPEGTGWY